MSICLLADTAQTWTRGTTGFSRNGTNMWHCNRQNWWLVDSNQFGMHEQYSKQKFHQIDKSAQQIILVMIVSKTSQVHSEQGLGCSRGQNSCQARKFLSAGTNEARNKGLHRIMIVQNLFLLVRSTTTRPTNHYKSSAYLCPLRKWKESWESSYFHFPTAKFNSIQ